MNFKLIVALYIIFYSCTSDYLEVDRVILSEDSLKFVEDCNGNVYKTIRLGNHLWLGENLKSDREQSWYFVSDDLIAGNFYSYSAASTVCECLLGGWRLPSNNDWEDLEREYLGMDESEIFLLDSSFVWEQMNMRGVNDTIGLTLGSILNVTTTGIYDRDVFDNCDEEFSKECITHVGKFCRDGVIVDDCERITYFWTSTASFDSKKAIYRKITSMLGFSKGHVDANNGLNVRCIKDL